MEMCDGRFGGPSFRPSSDFTDRLGVHAYLSLDVYRSLFYHSHMQRCPFPRQGVRRSIWRKALPPSPAPQRPSWLARLSSLPRLPGRLQRRGDRRVKKGDNAGTRLIV